MANSLTIGLYLLACAVAVRILRGRHALSEATRLALSYSLFFALMPLMTFHTHPHTFVFLLPAWTAIIAILMEDGRRSRVMIFGALLFAGDAGELEVTVGCAGDVESSTYVTELDEQAETLPATSVAVA